MTTLKRLFSKLLLLLFFLFFSTNLDGSWLENRYDSAKKKYAIAVLSSNKQKEIKTLKDIIRYGTKLKKNVWKYKKELRRITNKKKYIERNKRSGLKLSNNIKSRYKYSIKKISTNGNDIIIDFNHQVYKSYISFSKFKRSGYYYNGFDIKGKLRNVKFLNLQIKGIKRIIVNQYRYNTLRINIQNTYNIKCVYIIQNKRIIIRTYPKLKYTKRKINHTIFPNPISTNRFNTKTIVVDAGHGGKDAGAIGPYKRYEKVVVLKIAKYLYRELRLKGFRVYMTRSDDRFKPLKYRTSLANRKKADIFVSIHANSVSKRKAYKTVGIETFFLSPARSSRAKRVASLENKSDIKNLGYNSKNIVLELLNRGKITSSQKLAIDIQSHILYNLRKYYGKKIIDKGVREGPFWVLVGAQMPSVLVEVGYISNRYESQRLYSSIYQRRIAYGIANGILSYFAKN